MQIIKKYKLLIAIVLLALFLRSFQLSISPPSPYWEEAALGYDAYSISETAKDHHGNFLPIVAFESFGDYKPSLYFYVAAVFIKIFGLNVLAVRLPAIIASLFIIWGTAVLARSLLQNFYLKDNKKSATATNFVFYFTLFLASISPWLLTFSRSAWESTLATALIVWGVNFWFFFIEENRSKWALLSVFLLSLSTYAYHSARITAPLLGLGLLVAYFCSYLGKANHEKKKLFNWSALFLSTLIVLLVFVPIAKSLFEKTGQQRIAETSIFNDLSIIEKSNGMREKYGDSLIVKGISHRYILASQQAGINFLKHFGFDYLFVHGDNNPRHSIQSFGEFYYLDLLFFAFALVFFLSKKNKITFFLLFYIVASILPASFTKAIPHALRTLSALPMLIVFLTFGVWQFSELFKNEKIKKIILIAIVLAYLTLLGSFFYQLIFIYPLKYRSEWQFGYQEMVIKLLEKKNDFDKIYVTREKGRPAMYYFFYAKVDPKLVQAQNSQVNKDQGEFLSFENIEFIDKTEQIEVGKNSLIISSLDFYRKNLNPEGFSIIDSTENQSWIFYEIK